MARAMLCCVLRGVASHLMACATLDLKRLGSLTRLSRVVSTSNACQSTNYGHTPVRGACPAVPEFEASSPPQSHCQMTATDTSWRRVAGSYLAAHPECWCAEESNPLVEGPPHTVLCVVCVWHGVSCIVQLARPPKASSSEASLSSESEDSSSSSTTGNSAGRSCVQGLSRSSWQSGGVRPIGLERPSSSLEEEEDSLE